MFSFALNVSRATTRSRTEERGKWKGGVRNVPWDTQSLVQNIKLARFWSATNWPDEHLCKGHTVFWLAVSATSLPQSNQTISPPPLDKRILKVPTADGGRFLSWNVSVDLKKKKPRGEKRLPCPHFVFFFSSWFLMIHRAVCGTRRIAFYQKCQLAEPLVFLRRVPESFPLCLSLESPSCRRSRPPICIQPRLGESGVWGSIPPPSFMFFLNFPHGIPQHDSVSVTLTDGRPWLRAHASTYEATAGGRAGGRSLDMWLKTLEI